MVSYRLFKLCACLTTTNQLCFQHRTILSTKRSRHFPLVLPLSLLTIQFIVLPIYIFQLQQQHDNDSQTTKLTFLCSCRRWRQHTSYLSCLCFSELTTLSCARPPNSKQRLKVPANIYEWTFCFKCFPQIWSLQIWFVRLIFTPVRLVYSRAWGPWNNNCIHECKLSAIYFFSYTWNVEVCCDLTWTSP